MHIELLFRRRMHHYLWVSMLNKIQNFNQLAHILVKLYMF